MASWPEIQAGIFAGESGGDYDALFGFSNRPGEQFANTRLRDMTVNDAIAFSNPRGPYAQWVKNQIGRVATPMGAYQIVGTTLREAANALGLTGSEMMDEATQDRLGQWILARQGTDAWEGYKGPQQPGTGGQYSLPSGPNTRRPYGPLEAAGGGDRPDMFTARPGGPVEAAGGGAGSDPSVTPYSAPDASTPAAMADAGKKGNPLSKLVSGIGQAFGTGSDGGGGGTGLRPQPAAARVDAPEVAPFNPMQAEQQRQMLALTMQRLNSGRLF